jgi:hypothetical protein
MSDAAFLGFDGIVVLAGGLGYLVGRYQSHLTDKIKSFEDAVPEPEPEPGVTLGVYTEPLTISSPEDTRAVGLVETKTPERLEFEAAQELERQVKLGPQ